MYIDSLLYAVSVLLSLEVWLIIKVIKPTTLKKKKTRAEYEEEGERGAGEGSTFLHHHS